MRLRPSEIRYSQDSINNVFDKRSCHAWRAIGETLDDLCEGRCTIESIPSITVVQEGGRWISADNRRLWVFRELERLGKCETVSVDIGYYIPPKKRTSYNGGVSIRVRGPPGGYWHSRPTVTRPSTSQPERTNYITNQRSSADHRSTSVNTGHTGLEYRSRAFEMSSRMAGIEQRRPETYNIADQRSSAYHRSTGLATGFTGQENRASAASSRMAKIEQRRPETCNIADQRSSAYHRSTGLATGFTGQENRASAMSSRMAEVQQRRPQTALPATGRAPTLSEFQSLSINPSFECVSKYSYGVRVWRAFIPGTHPKKYKDVQDGVQWCTHCFDRLIKKGQILKPGQNLGVSKYIVSSRIGPFLGLGLYKSTHRMPILVNEIGCSFHDRLRMDLGALGLSSECRYQLKMVYVGGCHLKVIIKVGDTEQEFYTHLEVAENSL